MMSDVWCLTSCVWWLLSDVRCLMYGSDVWCLSSDVRRRMSNVWHQTIKTRHQTSCIHQSSDTSDIRRLRSYIRLLTSPVWHQTWDRHQMSDIRQQSSDIIHQTSDIRQQTSDIRQTIIVIWKFLALEKVIYTWDYTGQCYNILSQIPKDWSSSGFQRLHPGIWNWKGRLAREPPGPFDFERSRFWTWAP